MEKQYKIYRLILDEKTVYIGQTTLKYLSQRKNKHNYRNTFERIRESIIELIEITTDVTREQFWIDYYLNEGCVLLNKRRGATGLTNEERKEYKSEHAKEWYKKNKEEILEKKKLRYKLKKNENNEINLY